MKESKVKGKVFLPSYVKRNTSVRNIFADTDERTKHGARRAIKLDSISPALLTREARLRPGVMM